MKKTAEDLKQFKMHQDYVPIKGASLYVFTLEQINELLASQSRPAVLMPDVAKIYEYIKEEHHLRLHGKPGEMSTHRLTMGQAEYLQLCLDVAKWALSQVQAIDGRELLIKFAEFLNENINEDEIDAFLRDNAT